MADFQDSLPVLTENPGDVVAKIGDGSTPSQQLAVNSNGAASVALQDAAGDALAINSDGSLNVNMSSGAVGGEVHDFKQASAIPAAGSDNHDYTVTATKTLLLKQILPDASGRFRAELTIDPSGTPKTIFVVFGSGANGSGKPITLAQPVEVAAGVVVRVTMTNRSPQAQDLYSTIVGEEV